MTGIFGALATSPHEALFAVARGIPDVRANVAARNMFSVPDPFPLETLPALFTADADVRRGIRQAIENPANCDGAIDASNAERCCRLYFHAHEDKVIIHVRDIADVVRLTRQVGEYSAALVTNYFDLEVSRRAIGDAEKERTNLIQAAIEVVAMTMEMKDKYTYGHSRRVAALSRLIAATGELSRDEQDKIHRAALLHDIGKLGVISEILRKPGMLTEQEHAVIKRHPQYGHDLLINLPHFGEIADIVLHHHENWDGNGYPDGLAGDAIPLAASIIACADSFDAICTNRPYRNGRDYDHAREEIRAGSGRQFRPDVADWFLTLATTDLLAIETAQP